MILDLLRLRLIRSTWTSVRVLSAKTSRDWVAKRKNARNAIRMVFPRRTTKPEVTVNLFWSYPQWKTGRINWVTPTYPQDPPHLQEQTLIFEYHRLERMRTHLEIWTTGYTVVTGIPVGFRCLQIKMSGWIPQTRLAVLHVPRSTEIR